MLTKKRKKRKKQALFLRELEREKCYKKKRKIYKKYFR